MFYTFPYGYYKINYNISLKHRQNIIFDKYYIIYAFPCHLLKLSHKQTNFQTFLTWRRQKEEQKEYLENNFLNKIRKYTT